MSYEEYLAWKELAQVDEVKKKSKVETMPYHVRNSLLSDNPSNVRCGVCGQKIDQEVKN